MFGRSFHDAMMTGRRVTITKRRAQGVGITANENVKAIA